MNTRPFFIVFNKKNSKRVIRIFFLCQILDLKILLAISSDKNKNIHGSDSILRVVEQKGSFIEGERSPLHV